MEVTLGSSAAAPDTQRPASTPPSPAGGKHAGSSARSDVIVAAHRSGGAARGVSAAPHPDASAATTKSTDPTRHRRAGTALKSLSIGTRR